MTTVRPSTWFKIPVNLTELCLDTTLRCGQSFRWRKSEDDIWSCALHGRILSLKQDATHLHCKTTFPENSLSLLTTPASAINPSIRALSEDGDSESLLKSYFNLEPRLKDLYEQWSAADPNFKKKAPKFTGVRILKQDAWEALVGFICSSNNNIIRISQMMEKLCSHYGPLIGFLDSKPYYDMPPPSALTGPGVEAHLRQLGFGYRAKYLYQTATIVSKKRRSDWLVGLRNPESPLPGFRPASAGEMLPGGREGYRIAHEELLSLQGVGPKVADCICLMGLGWGEAVPVDTHVWQIAQRDYRFGKGKHSSLTKATYDAIGDKFRSLWGKEAGWAHSVLFTADLRAFSDRLVTKIEMDKVKQEVDVKQEVGAIVFTDTEIKTEVMTPLQSELKAEDKSDLLWKTHEQSPQRQVKRRRRA